MDHTEARSDSTSPHDTQLRDCNALESIFLELNVRFAACLVLETPVSLIAVEEVLKSTVLRSLSAQCEAEKLPSGKWQLRSRTSPLSLDKLEWRGTPERAVLDAVFSRQEKEVSIGMIASEGLVFAISINCNHALCDGRTMAEMLGSLSLDSTENQVPIQQHYQTPCDCRKSIQFAIAKLSARNSPTTELQQSIQLKSLELMRPDANASTPQDARFTITAEDGERVRKLGKQNRATVTGLWVAALAKSVADLHFAENCESTSCVIGVSVLVDVRPALDDSENFVNVFGTIVVPVKFERGDDSILTRAEEVTSCIRSRVSRGDALHSASALAEGRSIDEPKATLEFSNHGIYSVPRNSKLLLAQRFDDYEGISILVHSEKNSGCMRVVASGGRDVSETGLKQLTQKAVEAYTGVLPS